MSRKKVSCNEVADLETLLYPNIDSECVDLCRALNSIPGIGTLESCCGHGRGSFSVWFYAESFEGLFIIGRVLDRRYGSPDWFNWKCTVACCDYDMMPMFNIDSGGVVGEDAYSQSKEIAYNIYDHLEHSDYFEKWRRDRRRLDKKRSEDISHSTEK
jgi:hypothetical protein